jgi:hypothetical protein
MHLTRRLGTAALVAVALIATTLGPARALPLVTEITIHDTSGLEGTGEELTPFEVPVTLNAPDPLQPVSVDWRTVESSAKAGEDFVADSGTLVFEPGQTTGTITVHVVADDHHEFNDVFKVALSNPVNAVIKRATATVMIMNDDDPPVLTIDDVEVPEGDDGTTTAVLTVSVDRLSGLGAWVHYETVAGTATPGEDFVPKSGWVNIPAMTRSATIEVEVIGDTEVEGDESFTVVLSHPFRATIGRDEGTVTIIDDDAAPSRPGQGTGGGRDDRGRPIRP